MIGSPPPLEILEHLSYDERTGIFTRIKSSVQNSRYIGKQAGTLQATGYREIHFKGRKYREHRLAWLFVYGDWPDLLIDHKNGDPSDNRIVNLRVCEPFQNNANMRRKGGLPKGVTFNKKARKYQASVKCHGKCYYLGLHKTPYQAHAAYVEAAKNLFGNFARAA